jgi:hypothetical protein
MRGVFVEHGLSFGAVAIACAVAACSGGSGENGSDYANAVKQSSPDKGQPPPPSSITEDCEFGPDGEALELRCAGLYSDWSTKTLSSNLMEFVPGLQAWSDGAQKTRWIFLPPGQKIDTSDMDEWTFPVGTKLYKEFRLPVGNDPAMIRIETRLLWKKVPGSWYRTTYRWSADGETSAHELTGGETDADGNGYQIPSQSACNTCHDGRRDGVLGFEAVGLSAPGASLVTMATLVQDGLVTNAPAAPLAIPGDEVQRAALGFLHVNCGTACHNRGSGEAGSTHFYMRLDAASLASVDGTDTYGTGWNVRTALFQIPNVTETYRLRACDVGASAAYYRADHRDGVDGTPDGTQMPPIATHKVDPQGVTEILAWINEGCNEASGTP